MVNKLIEILNRRNRELKKGIANRSISVEEAGNIIDYHGFDRRNLVIKGIDYDIFMLADGMVKDLTARYGTSGNGRVVVEISGVYELGVSGSSKKSHPFKMRRTIGYRRKADFDE